ncbi:larval/pupal cuticle protein H1C-like [Zerene cesonia]|uniref:larval/pupal cuticle protein H1C-like n=1 Tax=Zerene cesonia TaxID=33412 RepID=UPI0018E4ECAF|nr:larval/pupal cuticle protein H1C-like [Zerene cesonia]
MMIKFVTILSCIAAATAGTINTAYSSAPAVSSVYSSINDPATKTPAPIYETTNEIKENAQDGSQRTTYSKSITSPFTTVQKYDTHVTSNGALLHTYPTIYSSPTHTPIYYNPTTYSVATPLVTKTYSTPIYTHSNTVPILTKTSSSGLATYSHGPVVQDQHLKTTITYSEAPLVSHMTFSGLGANYAW